MQNKEFIKSSEILRAFSDEKRLTILRTLCSGEKCACELLDHIDIGQSTLSHHMKILCNADVVKIRRSGKWTFYSINQAGVKAAKSLITDITTIQKEVGTKKSAAKKAIV